MRRPRGPTRRTRPTPPPLRDAPARRPDADRRTRRGWERRCRIAYGHPKRLAPAGPDVPPPRRSAALFAGLFRSVLADIPVHLGGIGSGALITLQQSGLALGVATLGTLYLTLA